MPLNQCEVNVLGCIRIHQASGEWRVEMTVFRFVVCGHTHTHVHVHIHTPKNSISQLRIRALAWGKGVNRFGIAGTQRSRKKTYSIPITRLIRPNPPVFCRGRQSRFPFYRGPGCTTAGEYTRFAPAEWQPLFRYSPLDLQFRPSIHEIPAFPRNPALFLAIRLAIPLLPRPFRVFASSCTPRSTSSRLPSPLPPCTFKVF